MSDDGGPAFPSRAPVVDMDPDTLRTQVVRSAFDGMSLRDYFAAAAISDVLVDTHFESADWDACAKAAYQLADAMLEARKAKP